MPTLNYIKLLLILAACSSLLGAGFFVGSTYQKGVVAEDRLAEFKKLTELTQERERLKHDLSSIEAKVKDVENDVKQKVENANKEADAVRLELKTTRSALSAKLAGINAQALKRDKLEHLDDTPVKPGTPRCRGPVLSPGLFQDINSAIEVSQ